MSNFKLLIDGQLVGAEKQFTVVNPASGHAFAQVPHATYEQCEQAISAAKVAFPTWSEKNVEDRREMLIELANKIAKNNEKLALSLVKEQGKPLAEAQMEVLYTEVFIRNQAEFNLNVTVLEDNEERRVEVHNKPLGVVAGIIPWNFPLLVVAFKLPPALLAGNTIVIKPAPTTPITTLLLGEMCAEIFPKGVVNIITDQNELGPVLSSHPDVAKVSVTGSTVTGKKVMASAAETIKRVTLELGGNDAAIVLDDADPAKIAENIVAGAFLNAGQVCIAIKRLYVNENIYDQLIEELAKHIKNLTLGNGLEDGVSIGPVQNLRQFEQAKALLDDAKNHARIVVGGEANNSHGYFIQPTLVADAKDGMRLVDEEQFSPILPVIRYTNLEDAINSANALDYGLGASVWSSDTARAYEVAKRIEAGTVWINKHLDFGPTIPLCGAKQSGFGVELAQEGLKEYTQTCVINIAK